MSYHSRYGGGDRDRYGDSRRHSSSSRRNDSPPRHRSRRSPSPGPSRSPPPKPRDPKELPDSFGRPQEARVDDDLSVLQRMTSSYESSPLAILYRYVEKKDKVKIWTRNFKEVRGVMTGYIVAFDKHWNLILKDVDEVFLKQTRSKTPFLRDVAPNENLGDIPPKVPRRRKSEKKDEPSTSEAGEEQSKDDVKEQAKDTEGAKDPKKAGSEKKKRQRGKKVKQVSEKRQATMLFLRGDNIVIISPAEDDSDIEEGEESAEEEQEVNNS